MINSRHSPFIVGPALARVQHEFAACFLNERAFWIQFNVATLKGRMCSRQASVRAFSTVAYGQGD